MLRGHAGSLLTHVHGSCSPRGVGFVVAKLGSAPPRGTHEEEEEEEEEEDQGEEFIQNCTRARRDS